MVPGFTERECQAAELRRRDLLAQAAWDRSLPAPRSFRDGRPSLVAAACHGIGAGFVRVGRRLQGGAELAPAVGGEPAVGLPLLR